MANRTRGRQKKARKGARIETSRRFLASHRMARISPFKARLVMDLIRGQNVRDALGLLEYEPRRAAPMIKKVLKSAIDNASQDQGIRLENLVVVDARVDGAGMLNGRRRWQPRAMGRAFPIIKRMSHLSVAVAEVEE